MSQTKIYSLTPHQKERMKFYRDKWMAIGLSTEPANRKEAERGIDEIYRIAGLKEPKKVWCMSPLSSGLTRYSVMNIKEVKVGKNVGDSVGDSVWDSVGASVGDSVRDSVWDSVGDSVRASVGDSVYGQHDAAWLGFYDYFNNELKLEKQTEKLKGLWIYSQNAGWAIPHENICWLSERHDVCKVNNQGRIHCDGGVSIHYPDGFSIWALNGVRVSKEIAETPANELSSKLISTEKNAQVRSEIIKKIGYSRILKDLKAKHMDSWREYELYRIDNVDIEPMFLLKFNCPSTGEFYANRVPPDCTKAREAIKWCNHGVDSGEFLVET